MLVLYCFQLQLGLWHIAETIDTCDNGIRVCLNLVSPLVDKSQASLHELKRDLLTGGQGKCIGFCLGIQDELKKANTE